MELEELELSEQQPKHKSEGNGKYDGDAVQVFAQREEDDSDDGYILDDEEDLGLLDWDQYARIRRRKFLGISCPDLSILMPLWWYRLPKQRRKYLSIFVSVVLFLLVLLGLYSLSGGRKTVDSVEKRVGGVHRLCDWSEYILPEDFVPSHYDVNLHVHWDHEPYPIHGKSKTTFEAPKSEFNSTKCLVLHLGQNIKMKHIAMEQAGDVQIEGKVIKYNETSSLAVIEFKKPIHSVERASLSLSFEYDLPESMRGFYKSTYRDQRNVTHMIASTQFEALDARRAFPCFDEPDLKATFDFEIGVQIEETATAPQVLFNTPMREGGFHRTEGKGVYTNQYAFETTPKMSTYLVAFVIGDLVSDTGSIDNGRIKVTVWGTPDHADDLGDALQTAIKVLPAYEDLFGIPFPLKKIDLVAIPSFEAGAMENWGLITYRETSLLIDSKEASDSDIFWATTTVAHELAHMWFGNLVTMKWWNDLYLNEGFAAYIEYIGNTVAKPNFKADTLFSVETLQNAMLADSYSSSHPLHTPAEKTYSGIDIDAQFDGISYDKGASLIRMLRNYLSGGESMRNSGLLGQDPFIKGLQYYLREYQYENANSLQFWAALETYTGKPISKYVESWINQPNYPVIDVTWQDKHSDGSGSLALSQRAFGISGIKPCTDEGKWWIPFGIIGRDSLYDPSWEVLDECKGGPKHVFYLMDSSDFLKLNPKQTGYFRVNYPLDIWERLAKNVASKTLSGIDAANLLDDAYELVQVRALKVSVVLDLAQSVSKGSALQSEEDFQAWSVMVSVLGGIKSKLESSNAACLDKFESVARGMISKGVESYNLIQSLKSNANTLEGEYLERRLKSLLFSAGVSYKDVNVENLALGFYDNAAEVNPSLKYSVYKVKARSGSEGFDEILEKYKVAEDPNEKERLLAALGAVDSPNLIGKALKLSMTPLVDPMYVRSLVSRVGSNSVMGREMAWNYLRNNFEQMYKKVNGDGVESSRLSRLVRIIASGFSEEERLLQLDKLHSKYPKWIPTSAVEQTKEKIKANKNWLENHEQEVCEWLATQT